MDWLHHLSLGRLDTLSLGLEYRNDGGTNKGSFSDQTDTWGGFLQNELRLFEQLFLTGGVQYDHHSVFGDQTTGRAAVSYLIRPTDTRLKGSWAEGFRAPTFDELFFPAQAPCPPFGNPKLRPETSESWDAGGEQQLWQRRLRLGATYFRNEFHDLIQATLIDPVNFCFQSQNVGRARTEGVEVEGSLNPIDGLLLTLAYTYTETEDLTAHQPLRRFPKHLWALTAVYEPLPGLTFSGEAYRLEPVRRAGRLPEPGVQCRERHRRLSPALARGPARGRHGAREGDESPQRGLLGSEGLPGAGPVRGGGRAG